MGYKEKQLSERTDFCFQGKQGIPIGYCRAVDLCYYCIRNKLKESRVFTDINGREIDHDFGETSDKALALRYHIPEWWL